jgi:hypothetical protein
MRMDDRNRELKPFFSACGRGGLATTTAFEVNGLKVIAKSSSGRFAIPECIAGTTGQK